MAITVLPPDDPGKLRLGWIHVDMDYLKEHDPEKYQEYLNDREAGFFDDKERYLDVKGL